MEEPAATQNVESAAANFLLESWATFGDGHHNAIDIGWEYNTEGIAKKRKSNPVDACDVLAACLQRRRNAIRLGGTRE